MGSVTYVNILCPFIAALRHYAQNIIHSRLSLSHGYRQHSSELTMNTIVLITVINISMMTDGLTPKARCEHY